MRIGGFQLDEPLPNLQEPHALAMLRPWVDVGSVGGLVLSRLENHYAARELGRLARPGNFFDFTRYRPVVYSAHGRREMAIPNAVLKYAERETGDSFLFLHLLEPHMFGEAYVDSVLLLLKKLGAKRYCLLGSMYDMVPHTRPLLVSGRATGKSAEACLRAAGIQTSDYEGPTSIANLIAQRAPDFGIETMSLIVHLPQYTQLDEDYAGQVRVLGVLSQLYDVPIDKGDVATAKQQRLDLDLAAASDPKLKHMVEQLEAHHDARVAKKESPEVPRLSPEVERFLREMDGRLGEG